ncbi:deaminase [Nakamurella endophytica]|uniref:tRNA-specific adenosine deaminase n=1 Tax=Nakamurella endophytica TaxID=1748367 RepID=A0A917WI10_9ACTN|nr:deaminase [Nakamurella endophytica]GGM05652.1 tRNA-specific adenosine deaminase [Nakamurella endophytica]
MTDPTRLATSFAAELPAWVAPFLQGYDGPTATSRDRMALVHALADRNWPAGNGGPFAAVVADPSTGEVVSVGVNVVLSSGLSSAHAEVTAICLAQRALGTWDLAAARPGLELVVNWRPCAMCFGAVLWSGVQRLVVAGDGPELEALTGFDEGPVVADWADQLAARGIDVEQDVLREGALATYTAYGTGRALVYNARRSTTG